MEGPNGANADLFHGLIREPHFLLFVPTMAMIDEPILMKLHHHHYMSCKYLDQNLHQNDLSISQLHNVRTFIPINLPFPICIHGARFDWNTKFIFYVY